MSHKPSMEIFLQPGEFFVGDANYRIRTLLGSCVSITLWHAARRIGAMSHFLLATRGSSRAGEPDGRYGDEALWLCERDLKSLGVRPEECVAKIFGGGDMFSHQTNSTVMNVGQKNGEAARRLLRSHGIPIVSESLFGAGHRQVIFDVFTGNVWSRQVKPVEPAGIESRVTA